jgi:hypothetical protein
MVREEAVFIVSFTHDQISIYNLISGVQSMATVRIYQPTKTAMQSGEAKTKEWRVEFETRDPLTPEPLMGWVRSNDMTQELHLGFSSLGEALHYATTHGLSYTIDNPCKISTEPKSYASAFTNPRIRQV